MTVGGADFVTLFFQVTSDRKSYFDQIATVVAMVVAIF
jgi:hypothetical protein